MSLLAVSCQKGVPRFFPYQLLQWKLLHNRSIIGVTWQLYHHQKNSSVVKKVNKSLPKRLRRERESQAIQAKNNTYHSWNCFLASSAAGGIRKIDASYSFTERCGVIYRLFEKSILHRELERISLGSLVCPK